MAFSLPNHASKTRIAIVVSHPIQHFCPQYASFATADNAEVKVFFGSCMGRDAYVDKNFGTKISWGRLYLDQFEHCFVNGDQVLPADAQLDAPGLNAQLEGFRPDIVIVYGHFQKLSRRAIQWARQHGCKIAYIADSELRQNQSWKRRLLRPVRASFFRSIDYFLTVGNANEEFYTLHDVDCNKFVRMHFSIDRQLYDAAHKERQQLSCSLRQELNVPDDAIVVSVVGKLVSWKSQDHLIDLSLRMRNSHPNMRYFAIGSGPSEGAWKERSEKAGTQDVVFTGFVPPDRLPAFYAMSDVYIHPALVEPHSLAISEAIYMGRPVICSNKCGSYGHSDDVQIGINGYVYPHGDIATLAKHLGRLASSVELRHSMGASSEAISRQFQTVSHRDSLQRLIARHLGDQ